MPYATYPSVFVREAPKSRTVVDHLLWGDFLREIGPREDGWVQVKGRGGAEGWIKDTEFTKDRVIEICFVDIGQGDGSLVVVPGASPEEDRFIIVDAGEGDNMFRFLRWRFNLGGTGDHTMRFAGAVITHPDSDHYKGFTPIFAEPRFTFDAVYHNGIVEQTGKDGLGAVTDHDGTKYITGVVEDRAALGAVLSDPERIERKLYPNLLKSALDGGRVGDIRMLCAEDRYLPGFEEGSPLQIKVLGPVPERGSDGGRTLRWFGERSKPGPTKNGHSIILKLQFGNVSVLLGGDLNIPAEHYLLSHYTGRDPAPESEADREALVEGAREVFEADFAKACHHGSADFSSLFLRGVNAMATVISSGDAEPHCHPRPDALGAFGKHGRGDRPLIFSTELARSAKEQIKNPNVLRARIDELYELREQTSDEATRTKINEKIEESLKFLDRSVAVYGMINLRTDGANAIIAQKLEERRSGTGEEWDIHRFEPGPDGAIVYRPKHKD
jgi:beta-lactamase superfamily II metal-dependent hydrolase